MEGCPEETAVPLPQTWGRLAVPVCGQYAVACSRPPGVVRVTSRLVAAFSYSNDVVSPLPEVTSLGRPEAGSSKA